MTLRQPLLRVRSVSRRFGGLMALDDVSFDVSEGQIKAIIGPNGAGKTTLLNVICGIDSPTTGSVEFDGRQISSTPTHRIAARGVGRTFQTVRTFGELSVLGNVMVGRHLRSSINPIASGLRLPAARVAERSMRDRAYAYLELVGLAGRADEPAHALSHGAQRWLELARALAAEPRLLCLDEPAAGLTAAEADELANFLRRLRDERHLTIILIEHHMPLVMGTSDEVAVLDYGKKIADGPPEHIATDSRVIEAYLGAAEASA